VNYSFPLALTVDHNTLPRAGELSSRAELNSRRAKVRDKSDNDSSLDPLMNPMPMSLDTKLVQRLEKALAVVDDHGTVGPRLREDALRIWRRIGRFQQLGLLTHVIDADALELACYALQLPLRQDKRLPTGKPARASLRDRAEEAAEMLVGLLDKTADESLLDRTTRLLHEMPHRSPMLDEAKLLADAVNLDDFGVIGIVNQIVQLARQGEGLAALADGLHKREQYGYWDARIRDGFHFLAARNIAQTRLARAREVAKLLAADLQEDHAV
jgi:hypothetical protein